MRVRNSYGVWLGAWLLACSGTSSGNPVGGRDPIGDKGDVPVPKGATLVRSDLPRDEDPQLSEGDSAAFGAGNRGFAFALYGEVSAAADPDENVFISPFSISTAMAMAYAGAEGETASEMSAAMQFELDEPGLHEAFNATDRALEGRADELPEMSEGDGFELHSVNQAWGRNGASFQEPYLDVLAQNYGAGMYLVDFGDSEPTRMLINDWVAEQTKDRVKDLLPMNSLSIDTVMVLTNAIYFKASWSNKFDVAMTQDGEFMAESGPRTLPMMHQANLETAYAEGDGYQAVELPYLSPSVRMLLVMPAAGQLDALIGSMDEAWFAELRSNLQTHMVDITLPKFSFEYEQALSAPLEALGMPLAFSMGADFSGIVGSPTIWIDEVYHKTFVAVDEEGTEAAAATAVVFTDESAKPQAEIRLDRPFVFMIYDEPTGQILFLGHLREPQ